MPGTTIVSLYFFYKNCPRIVTEKILSAHKKGTSEIQPQGFEVLPN